MLPEELIKQLPDWALYLCYGLIAIGAAAKLVHSLKVGAKQEGDSQAAARTVTAVSAAQTVATGLTSDEVLRTFAALTAAIDRLTDRLNEQDQAMEAEERADELFFRRQVRELVRSGGAGLVPKEPK